MAMVASWPGTDKALVALQRAVNHHCTCRDAEQTCPAHKMLTDQQTLNHLAFAACLVPELRRQEWRPTVRRRG